MPASLPLLGSFSPLSNLFLTGPALVLALAQPRPAATQRRLCGDDETSKQVLQTIEVVNGRIAMLATVGYVVQEYITGEYTRYLFNMYTIYTFDLNETHRYLFY